MASDVNPSGHQKPVREFPIQSLRDFLIPDVLLKVKLFEAKSLNELDAAVNEWVAESKAIVATVSPAIKTVTVGDLERDCNYTLSLTYLPAVE